MSVVKVLPVMTAWSSVAGSTAPPCAASAVGVTSPKLKMFWNVPPMFCRPGRPKTEPTPTSVAFAATPVSCVSTFARGLAVPRLPTRASAAGSALVAARLSTPATGFSVSLTVASGASTNVGATVEPKDTLDAIATPVKWPMALDLRAFPQLRVPRAKHAAFHSQAGGLAVQEDARRKDGRVRSGELELASASTMVQFRRDILLPPTIRTPTETRRPSTMEATAEGSADVSSPAKVEAEYGRAEREA